MAKPTAAAMNLQGTIRVWLIVMIVSFAWIFLGVILQFQFHMWHVDRDIHYTERIKLFRNTVQPNVSAHVTNNNDELSCSIGEGGEELSELDERCKEKRWTEYGEQEDFDSLLFRVTLEEEYRDSLSGTILQPLRNYKNPCWYAVLTKDQVPHYKKSRLKERAHARELRVRLNMGKHWRLLCFPEAFIIGAAKSGTTDMFRRLSLHPQIYMPPIKENFYWNWGRLLGRRLAEIRPQSFSHYLNYYAIPADNIRQLVYDGGQLMTDYLSNVEDRRYHPGVTIDATATYSYCYDGWELIPGNHGLLEPRYLLPHTLRAIHPHVKGIVILRNPTDRAYSHHKYIVRSELSPELFHQHVLDYMTSWHNCIRYNTARGCAYNATLMPPGEHTWSGMFLKAGLYSIFIRDWLEALPPKHLHITRAEDYYANESDVIKDIFEFLDVGSVSSDAWSSITRRGPANTAAKRGPSHQMLLETKRILDDYYRPFNLELAQLLNNEKFAWHNIS